MDTPAVTSRGSLALRPLAHLLVYSKLRGLSGTFVLVAPSAGAHATVLLDAGNPVKVKSNFESVYLGRVLLEAGDISQDEHDASLLALAEGGRLHGQVLLERRAINVAQLRAGLVAQLTRNLDALFRLPVDTTFEFYADADLLADFGSPEHLPIDPLPRVLVGLRENPPWVHIDPSIDKLRVGRLRISKGAQIERCGLRADERRLVELLRIRPLTLDELTANAESLGVNGAKLLCYFLAITKQLELAPDADRLSDGEDEPSWAGVQSLASAPPSSQVLVPVAGAPPPRAMVGRVHLKSLAVGPRSYEERNASSGVDRRVTPVPSALRAVSVAEVSAVFDEARADIARRVLALETQTYFDVLGVSAAATVEQIKAAFIELARSWHPDRMPRELHDQRDSVARIFSRMGEANACLSDDSKRLAYLESLENPGDSIDDQATVAAALAAALSFQRAEVAFKRQDYAQAEAHARRACAGDPGQADYLALLAWVESMRPEAQSEAACRDNVAMLDRAIGINPNSERAFYYRGMLFKRLREDAAACRDFKRAVEINPRNIDASREVRIFEMRKGQPAPSAPEGGGGGLFGRLFKKR